ncbi:hypothetical protein EYF80_017597 [Liparis tanakae]|uniref:Uncharacterized protein n=1 Tax=Liparis tanakae TaxID=230148 RepID=A0A4Z2I257_9TELE|nr:hypothetical protein EYF80_017597 [Liparis tanakae]
MDRGFSDWNLMNLEGFVPKEKSWAPIGCVPRQSLPLPAQQQHAALAVAFEGQTTDWTGGKDAAAVARERET